MVLSYHWLEDLLFRHDIGLWVEKTVVPRGFVEQFVRFFIKIEQISLGKSAFWMCRRPIYANRRILFEYTDIDVELCSCKL